MIVEEDSLRRPPYYSSSWDEFLPLEFSATPTSTPSDEFLSDIGSFLQEHELREVFGVENLKPTESEWVEHLLPNGTGTVAAGLAEGTDRPGKNDVITAWTFRCDNAGVRIVVHRKCVVEQSGGHRVV